ncbi:hypothetical protein BBJ28_00014616 [Nothophytophthora sp. Chile5]|nr:hypothetical protein BBJ28_00014616 [Nothophytophthora sp. Chile5]
MESFPQAVAVTAGESGSMRLVLDTDAGVDDAIAILMALHAFPKEQVVGVTTVFGNVDLHQANHNVAQYASVLERGMPKNLTCAGCLVLQGHGPDGLGGESGKIEAPLQAARRNEAVHALIDLAHQFSGELVVVALGPLTNVALAILLDPSFVSNVKQLVVMGGLSRGEGNQTPHSEFNVACDPEATDIVYQHCTAAKLHVVPFETCLDNALPWDTFDQIFHAEANAKSGYIRKVWKFTRAFCEHEGFLPCDAYAIAILLHPEYVKTSQKLKGCIHLAPDDKRGACIWDESCLPEEANVTLVTEIDSRVFIELLHHLAA